MMKLLRDRCVILTAAAGGSRAFRVVSPCGTRGTGVRSAYRLPGPASCTRAPRSRFSIP